MHAIFSGQRLDEIFQTHIATDIVTDSDCLLNCKKAGSKGRVERLQVVGKLVHDWLELGVPLVGGEGIEEGVETTKGGDGGTMV